MKYLSVKYGQKDLAVFGQFAYDIQDGEKMSNKEIAHHLHKMNFIDEKGMPVIPNLKFLEKQDLNGAEMHELYKFLKRNNSQLFVPRYGMACRLYEYHNKFLCNKYGEVKKFYGPETELAKKSKQKLT